MKLNRVSIHRKAKMTLHVFFCSSRGPLQTVELPVDSPQISRPSPDGWYPPGTFIVVALKRPTNIGYSERRCYATVASVLRCRATETTLAFSWEEV